MSFSQPPRKLLLHHRLILLNSGTMLQIGWAFVAMGSFFLLLFGMLSLTGNDQSHLMATIFVSIFPLIGIISVFVSLKTNFKTVDLLTNGKFAEGKVIDQKATNVKINDQTVMEYTVRFEAEDGNHYEVKGRTHLRSKVGEEALERVLYLSADPSWGTIFDTIPNGPQFLQDGQIAPPHWSSLFVLFLPTIGMLSFLGLIYTAVSSLPLLFP